MSDNYFPILNLNHLFTNGDNDFFDKLVDNKFIKKNDIDKTSRDTKDIEKCSGGNDAHPGKKNKRHEKVDDESLTVPTMAEYDLLLKNNYNQKQLKFFAKEYKLKISGNKSQLVERIYTYLRLSSFAIKVQKMFRGILQRRYNSLHGPAFMKREICTNDSDFLTGDDIKDIPPNQFFSFQDNDNFIYGFDIVSLHNLIAKSGKNVKNPYNRNAIPVDTILQVKKILLLSRILKIPVNIEIQDISQDISTKKSMELRILDLFQNIDSLGNYSNPQWFQSLNRVKTIKFIRELSDIWDYRAQLTMETKKLICPPYGMPFRNINNAFLNNEQNVEIIKKSVLEILEKMVNSGIDADSRSLGAYYVLAALTLVNEEAANALPWLFQSVS